jgi:hypothetical protein
MSRATHTHTTEITLEVEIEYVYDPGEPMVDYYPDGSGYPGIDPSVAIEKVTACGGGSIYRGLPDKVYQELREEILENHDAEDGE